MIAGSAPDGELSLLASHMQVVINGVEYGAMSRLCLGEAISIYLLLL